jgi:hypothetical protein
VVGVSNYNVSINFFCDGKDNVLNYDYSPKPQNSTDAEASIVINIQMVQDRFFGGTEVGLKVKVQFALEHAMKAHRGSRSIVLHFF